MSFHNILIAPDSFKGTASASEVAQTIADEIRNFDDQVNLNLIPMADGGEGSLDLWMRLLPDAETKKSIVSDPLGRPILAQWLWDSSTHTAYIEMAKSSGLTLLMPHERNPLKTTTFGVGELIANAIQKGAEQIFVALGGSATVDGGGGCDHKHR